MVTCSDVKRSWSIEGHLACMLSEGLGGVELEALLEDVKALYST